MKIPRAALFSPILLLALLEGCAVTGPGEVASKWSCKLREMQISPIFPPREDVYVGDVYWLPDAKPGVSTARDAYCNWKPENGFLDIGTHMASIDLKAQLVQHYQARPSLPRTGTSTISVSQAGSNTFMITSSPRDTVPDGTGQDIFQGKADRTRLIAFPDFMSFQVRSFDLGAILPVGGMLTPFGISSSTAESAVISIPVAESYGLPWAPALQALNAAPVRDSLCDVATNNGWSNQPGALYMVLEVFYARAIDVDIRARDGFAFSVAHDRPAESATTLATLPGGGSTPVIVVESTGEPQAAGMASAAARNVFDLVNLRNSVPGVTMGYRQGGSSQIGLRRLFDRPVAIGYRTVRLVETNSTTGAAPKCLFNGVASSTNSVPMNSEVDGTRPVEATKQ